MSFLQKNQVTAALSEMDKWFLKWSFEQGKDFDGVAGHLQKACSQGNADYVDTLLKDLKVKDMAKLANLIVEKKGKF